MNVHLPAVILLTIALITAFSPVVNADCQNKMPSKSSLEELFGQPIDKAKETSECFDPETKEPAACPCVSGEFVCYRKSGLEMRVKYDASNRAPTIEIFGRDGMGEINRIATRLVFGELTEKNWNKFNELFKKDLLVGGCQQNYRYEDDCLTMDYMIGNGLCTDSVPVIFKITWKI